MSDEFDELISAPAPKRNRGGRPTKAEVAAREAEAARSEDDFWTTPQMQAAMKAAASGNTLIDERVFHMPVSQNFLARVLNMDAMTVNRRLRRVKPSDMLAARSRSARSTTSRPHSSIF
jgi:hypothetical protein